MTALKQRRISCVQASGPAMEAAETVLQHLLNFHSNFPSVAGWELVGSAIVEQDDMAATGEWTPDCARFFAFDDDMVLSMVEMPVSAGVSRTRVILRDVTGRYVWDSQLSYIPPADGMYCSMKNINVNLAFCR